MKLCCVLSAALTILGQILVPVFALIALGWGLRRGGLLTEAGGRDLSQLLYWVCLPAQLVLLTSRVDLTRHLSPAALGAIGLSLAVGMTIAWRASARLPTAMRGCVMNGAVRANGAFIGLPVIELVAHTLPPDAGTALVGVYAMLLGPSVIAFNVIAVIAFRLPYHGVTAKGIGHALAELPRSPLIIGCAVGSLLGAIQPGMLDTGPIGGVVSLLASVAVPLALLVAGNGLDFAHLREHPRIITLTVTAKLALVPLATWLLCRLFGADAQTTTAATVLMASPVAMASVPMARLLGGDAALMAALVTATTIGAPLTLLVWLLLVGP